MRAICSAILSSLILINCSDKNHDPGTFLLNKEPKYNDREFVTLEKLFEIHPADSENHYFEDVSQMEVDENGNLFILDNSQRILSVFDTKGDFIKRMGSYGQGPREFEKLDNFAIFDNKIHLHERYKGIKIWNMEGEYLDFITLKSTFYPGNNSFGMFGQFFSPFGKFYLSSFCADDLDGSNLRKYAIARYTNDLKIDTVIASLDAHFFDDFAFQPTYVAVNSDLHIYFPEIRDQYIIHKYDINGSRIGSFGRVYEREPYSQEITGWYNDRFKRQIKAGRYKPLPKYPPVVSKIMVDENDLVWVIVGESTLDCYQSFMVNTRVDIFDNDGIFLYTFKTDMISWFSEIRNGKLYTPPTPVENNPVVAYKINYNY